jgi:(S)-2-hydroxyglutarate dehydrogenase
VSKKYDLIIIGAGLLGLTSAYQILKKEPSCSIAILDKERKEAQHQSGHNSGVIHSGVYYNPGSLKAKNCLLGRRYLLSFCDQFDIPYKMIGKLIVSTREEQIPTLDEIQRRGLENGVEGLSLINKKELQSLEPNVQGKAALHVQSCGIISYPDVATKLVTVLKEQGVEFFFERKVKRIEEESSVYIHTSDERFQSKALLSCAGIGSDHIAKMLHLTLPYQMIPFRGDYYVFKKTVFPKVKRCVYPTPDLRYPFLGVHFTPTMHGDIEIGPSAVLAFGREAYRKSQFCLKDMKEMFTFKGFYKVIARDWKRGIQEQIKSLSKWAFVRQARELVPSLYSSEVTKGMSGIRAQLVKNSGELVHDFAFEQTEKALILLNAPSPAATASFAIGEMMAEKILAKLDAEEKVYC